MAVKMETIGKEYLQKAYLQILNDEGYKAKIDSEGDIVFKKEGKNIYIDLAYDETEFFRIVLPRFNKLDDSDISKALDIINEMNRLIKSIKIYIEEDKDVTISYESFYSQPEDIKDIIERVLDLLIYGVSTFKEKFDKKTELK